MLLLEESSTKVVHSLYADTLPNVTPHLLQGKEITSNKLEAVNFKMAKLFSLFLVIASRRVSYTSYVC